MRVKLGYDLAWYGPESSGPARLGSHGVAWRVVLFHGAFRRGTTWQSSQGQVLLGRARHGASVWGVAGEARLVEFWQVDARYGRAVELGYGLSGSD